MAALDGDGERHDGGGDVGDVVVVGVRARQIAAVGAVVAVVA